MAKPSSVELDFFSMKKEESNSALPPPPAPVFQRRRSFRDIQGVITKMNPELVKSVIGNGCASSSKSPLPTNFSHVPLRDPKLSLRDEKGGNRAPMTIFYNGMVSVFDVSPHKAQDILKVAEEFLPSSTQQPQSLSNSYSERNLLESLNGDLPISRKNSLQRFLEKRKDRVDVNEDVIT